MSRDVKKAALVKKVEGVGTAPKKKDMVVFRFHDKDTGKTKCAAVVEIADTYEDRRIGLSKRASLSKFGGMYFECRGPFWMKDVEFPLDLCYLDEYGRVTEKYAMAKDKSGGTLYPATSTASVSAVELPEGFCDKYGVGIGDYVVPAKMHRG